MVARRIASRVRLPRSDRGRERGRQRPAGAHERGRRHRPGLVAGRYADRVAAGGGERRRDLADERGRLGTGAPELGRRSQVGAALVAELEPSHVGAAPDERADLPGRRARWCASEPDCRKRERRDPGLVARRHAHRVSLPRRPLRHERGRVEPPAAHAELLVRPGLVAGRSSDRVRRHAVVPGARLALRAGEARRRLRRCRRVRRRAPPDRVLRYRLLAVPDRIGTCLVAGRLPALLREPAPQLGRLRDGPQRPLRAPLQWVDRRDGRSGDRA